MYVNVGYIDNMVMQFWLTKQGRVGHLKSPLFLSDLFVEVGISGPGLKISIYCGTILNNV